MCLLVRERINSEKMSGEFSIWIYIVSVMEWEANAYFPKKLVSNEDEFLVETRIISMH